MENVNSPQDITLELNDYDDEIVLRNYREKLNQFDDIRSQIQHSDTILGDIESYLTSFQKDLNFLSAEMESLETRSRALNRKLIIRQNAEQKLAPVVEALIIPPVIVQQISDGEISMQWLAALKYINQRQNELAIMLKERQEFKAIKAAEQQLQIVSRKALERIRNYMASRIKSLRNFGVNSQTIQKELLDYRDLYSYLRAQCPQLADDILQAYINTMSWYYMSYFQRYIKALEKMNIHKVERNVLLGSDEGGKRGLIFSRSAAKEKTSMQVIMDSMNLGNRGNIITSDDPSVILAQIAETSANAPAIYHMETGFRSLNLALLDNVTIEYQFLQDFFQLKPGDQVNKVFDAIFEKTFDLGQEYTKFLTQDSYDSYGILICIRLCRKLEFESQHRRIPVMDNYLNLQLINLWPRFQSVMDAHCESLHRASSRSTLHSFVAETTGAGSVGGGGIGSSAAALVPHPLTQAFSSFVAGILALCENEDSTSEPVARSLVRLRNEFESVLTKLSAAAFGSESSNSKSAGSKREKFLYNNYFLVSTILSDLSGPLADQEKEHFKMLTEAYEPESEKKKKESSHKKAGSSS